MNAAPVTPFLLAAERALGFLLLSDFRLTKECFALLTLNRPVNDSRANLTDQWGEDLRYNGYC